MERAPRRMSRALAAVLFCSALVAAVSWFSVPASRAGLSGQHLQSLYHVSQAQRTVSLHLENPKVRSQFLGDFDRAKKQHLDRIENSAKVAKKKPMTAAEKKAMIAKMKALSAKIMSDFDSNTRFGKRVNCSYPYPAASCKGHAISTKLSSRRDRDAQLSRETQQAME